MSVVRVEERGVARRTVMDRPDARNALSRTMVES